MRYKFSSSILKRINDEDDSFLIVLFPSTHKKPEFYKCTTSQLNLEFTLFSGQEKLITARNLCNNIYSNKASHLESDRFITVDLLEIKEGFKLKMFVNAINETWKNGVKALKIFDKKNNEEQSIEKQQQQQEFLQPNPYEPIKQQQHEFLQPHPCEPINRSCVSDISILSDDDSSQQQQQRKFINYETVSTQENDDLTAKVRSNQKLFGTNDLRNESV